MNEEQVTSQDRLRHWLAVRCPERESMAILNHWLHNTGTDLYYNKTFEECHGVKPSLELARYAWADRMLAASAISLTLIDQ